MFRRAKCSLEKTFINSNNMKLDTEWHRSPFSQQVNNFIKTFPFCFWEKNDDEQGANEGVEGEQEHCTVHPSDDNQR